MADDNGGGQGGAAQGTEPAGVRAQLGIQSQYVKDLSFENPRAPESLVQTGEPPDIKLNVEVKVRALHEGIYEVSLHVTADAKREDKALFLLELTYNGVFSVSGVPADTVQLVLLVECPRLLFPFARRVIADATRDGGFPPLMMSPIDFLALYQKRQAEAAPA